MKMDKILAYIMICNIGTSCDNHALQWLNYDIRYQDSDQLESDKNIGRLIMGLIDRRVNSIFR